MKPHLRIISLLLMLSMFLNLGVSGYAFLIAVTTVEETPTSMLASNGEDWSVNVTINPEENWPDGLEIRAKEIEEPTIFLERVGNSSDQIAFSRFFELGLFAGDIEIQPEGKRVKVEIEIPELENEDVDIQVVHFADEAPVAEDLPLLQNKNLLKNRNVMLAEVDSMPILENDTSIWRGKA